MKRIKITRTTGSCARLLTLMLIASLAISLAAVAVAAAAGPEFKPASGQSISGASGSVKLSGNNGAETITCETSTAAGTVTSALLLGNITVHFLGCTSAGKTKSGCAINSTNTTTSGLILTTTLHGILGLVLPADSVGLLILPVSGKRFLTIAKNECTAESAMTGNIAGIEEPTGKSATTDKLIFAISSGKQAIKTIDLTHGLGLVEPELVLFTTTATLDLAVSNTFGAATEIT